MSESNNNNLHDDASKSNQKNNKQSPQKSKKKKGNKQSITSPIANLNQPKDTKSKPSPRKTHAENQMNKIDENSESKNEDSESRKIPQDVRIAVIGNVDSGKSTMIGVLTSGECDDGRGSARSRILRHNHEKSNGRTSCSSQHILGFNNKKKPVHQPISISATPKQKTAAWTSVFTQSKNIVTFIDLAGHEKYLKTTISGLTGCFPDYSFIVVGANMGISKMTREHIQVAIALSIPLFVVITKIDISPERILKHTVKTLVKLLRSPACNNKMPMIIRKKKEIKLLFEKDLYLERICPIFCVSAVKGDNIDKLNYFLSQLQPRTPWKHKKEEYVMEEKENEANKKLKQQEEEERLRQEKLQKEKERLAKLEKKKQENKEDQDKEKDLEMHGELEIDETFAVRGVGIVVSGTVTGGRIYPNQKLYLGPFTDSSFKEILVRSVHMKRCAVPDARAGESCSVSFRFIKRKEVVDRIMIRKGMVAVSDEAAKPKPVWGFTATILVLHHPTTINEGYQPVVHCGNIRQTATIMKMSKHRLRSGDSALIDMKFLCHPEYLHSGRAVIIREGSTKCIGKVIQLYPNYDINLSNFKELEKKYLNIQNFERDYKNGAQQQATMIFDETKKIITKDDLHKLEEEMKQLKAKQKQMKQEKKKHQKELNQNQNANDTNVGVENNNDNQ